MDGNDRAVVGAGLKRKLATDSRPDYSNDDDDDYGLRSSKRLLRNNFIDQDSSGSLSLGKRGAPDSPATTNTHVLAKRQRVLTADYDADDREDMLSRLSVIEMPLSMRAHAFLQSSDDWNREGREQRDRRDKRENGYGSNAMVLYSPSLNASTDAPLLSDELPESMNVD